MIGVRKISHASYETPDLEKQAEYYTNVLGLTLMAKERDAIYLANASEHHSVILRHGLQPKCTRIGFLARARRRSRCVREADRRAWAADVAQEVSRAHDQRHGRIRGTEGHHHGGVQAAGAAEPGISQQRNRSAQIGPRRLPRDRRQVRHAVLLRRSGLSRFRLDGRLLLLPAMRGGPSHDQSGRDRLEQAFSHGIRAARLGAYAKRLRFPEQERLQDFPAPDGTASATISSPTIAARTG